MEKAREMRRNGTRLPPGKRLPKASSGHKLISALNGGDVDFSERPKREKLRASSHLVRAASSNEDSEMGGGSEGEEDLRPPSSTRRVKVNGKPFDECNPVDPASVPRKLRSAMSKRNRESISPPLPDAKKHQVSNGADWSGVNGGRKSKQTHKAGSVDKSPKRAPRSSISKDEEEVVEALYALACISPSDKPSKSRGDRKPTTGKTASLPEMKTCSLPPQEALKEEKEDKEEIEKLPDLSVLTVTSNVASSKGEPLDDRAKVEAEKELSPTVAEQPSPMDREKLDLEKGPGGQNDMQTISLLPKDEIKENPQLNKCVKFLNPMGISSDSYAGNRLLNPLPAEAPAATKTNNETWAAITATKIQSEAQPAKENKESGARLPSAEEGPELWPIIPYSRSSDSQSFSNRLIGAKNSAVWPDSASHASRAVPSGNDVLMAKLPPVLVDKRPSWKRCETHVHISRFIHGYQGSEKKKKWTLPLPAKQSKANDGAKQAVSASTSEPPSLKIGTSSIVSSSTNSFAVEKNLQEARVGLRPDNRLLQDQQASATSSSYGQHKQRCDFLSLLPGCGTGLETSGRSQVSYLQSLVQHQSHHPVMPFSLPHARYSSPYTDQMVAAAATAQQMQLPQYLPNHPYSPHLVQPSAISKQQQQQQQQNQLWAAQLAQYRSSNIASPDLSKWPSGSSSPVIPPTSTSSSMIDTLGNIKYQTTNQQFFANMTTMAPSRGQRPLQSGSFEDGVGFRSDAPPPPHLQLLCNAQHL